jgi:ribosomal subunit interface protein
LNITFTAIGLQLTPTMIGYSEKKLADSFQKHLRDFAQSVILRFTFAIDKVSDPNKRHVASLSVNVGGSQVKLCAKSADLYAAIDDLQHKLTTALTRLWNRKYARRGRGRREARAILMAT